LARRHHSEAGQRLVSGAENELIEVDDPGDDIDDARVPAR
jgi:hypothetical protein